VVAISRSRGRARVVVVRRVRVERTIYGMGKLGTVQGRIDEGVATDVEETHCCRGERKDDMGEIQMIVCAGRPGQQHELERRCCPGLYIIAARLFEDPIVSRCHILLPTFAYPLCLTSMLHEM
jgi:hypothetical protein